MITGKRFYIVTSFLFIYTGLTSTNYAKTMYVISNTNEGVIRAYEVQDSNLVYQAQYDSDIIEMLNAKSMISEENFVKLTVERT